MQALSNNRHLLRRGLMGLMLTAAVVSHTALAAPFTDIPSTNKDGIPNLYQAWNAITGQNLSHNADLEPFRLDPSMDQLFTLNSLTAPILGRTAQFVNTLGFYAPGDTSSVVLSDNPINGYGLTNDKDGRFVSTTFNTDTLPGGPVGLALRSVTNGGQTNLFFSEEFLNPQDAFLDHLVAYQVGDNLLDGLLADFGVIDMVNPIMLGFEDIQHGGDRDFDDIIFLVDATPVDVPLPATLWLFAGGLLASGVVKRRR